MGTGIPLTHVFEAVGGDLTRGCHPARRWFGDSCHFFGPFLKKIAGYRDIPCELTLLPARGPEVISLCSPPPVLPMASAPQGFYSPRPLLPTAPAPHCLCSPWPVLPGASAPRSLCSLRMCSPGSELSEGPQGPQPHTHRCP